MHNCLFFLPLEANDSSKYTTHVVIGDEADANPSHLALCLSRGPCSPHTPNPPRAATPRHAYSQNPSTSRLPPTDHSIHPPTPRNPPARAKPNNHGDPVLRRRVPPLRLPAQRGAVGTRPRPRPRPAWPGGGGARGGGGRRDKPVHPEGGGEGGRHCPRRRALQAAHPVLPVRPSPPHPPRSLWCTNREGFGEFQFVDRSDFALVKITNHST